MVYNCLNIIHTVLFPYVCSLCGQDSQLDMDLCGDCLADLQTPFATCKQCGLPITTGENSPVCGNCLKSPPHFQNTLAAFSYSAPITRLIADLKYNGKHPLARVFADAWLHHFADHDIALPEAIVPVPLHRRKMWTRGYNQALEIARPIARHYQLPILTDHVVRTRHTRPQTELDARERKKNVRGSFRIKKEIPCSHVAIMDDVVTTGSTVRELARLLADSGVAKIDVWCIARATNQRL